MEREACYVVGIDLGTTNSALSYAKLDAAADHHLVHGFPIPQITASGELISIPLLPSFIALPGGGNDHGEARLPWGKANEYVGIAGKVRAGLTPATVIQSSKSWLSHTGVNRQASILPWGMEGVARKWSPVDSAAAILDHLRSAWNHGMSEGDERLFLENQDVIITIPASFDESARALTVEAAKRAGLPSITLVEEPQAAFYWWIESHREQWNDALPGGGIILVCDIGGGTTDLSLIRISPSPEGPPGFERLAIGRHLLLGGDNVDNALAKQVEARGGQRLDLRQWVQVVARCREVKEAVLGGDEQEEFHVQVQGSSSRLVGGAVQVSFSRPELEEWILEGFTPLIDAQEEASTGRSRGLVQQGLPYERDPAITRHILHFLQSQAQHGAGGGKDSLLIPDAIFFNGGATRSDKVRQRITQAVAQWGGEENIPVLKNDEPDRAVSLGAVRYGLSRRGAGVRIRGGSARSFFVSIGGTPERAVCVLPHGSEEGRGFRAEVPGLEVKTNQAVQFHALGSSTRIQDAVGDLVVIKPDEMDRLPVLVTALNYGKGIKQESIQVDLEAELTAVGTISLACGSRTSPHLWKMEFAVEEAGRDEYAPVQAGSVLDSNLLERAGEEIEKAYEGDGNPETLMRDLERALEHPRGEWSIDTLRGLWPFVLSVASKRNQSPQHEARWFNLAGYCLRPGTGQAGDAIRCKELWKESVGGGVYATRSQDCWKEWWVMWRRVAGGLKPGQQTEIWGQANRLLGGKKVDTRKLGRGPAEKAELQELWMLAGSLERVEKGSRLKAGRQALKYLTTEQLHRYGFWVLGRLGARALLHGGAEQVLPASEVEQWVRDLVERSWRNSEKVSFELIQLARMTGDRSIDLSAEVLSLIREKAIANGASKRTLELLDGRVELETEEQERLHADSLPLGLAVRTPVKS